MSEHDSNRGWRSWLARTINLFGSASRPARTSVRSARRRPELEILEGRVLPSARPIVHDDFADTDGINPVTIRVLANDASTIGLDRRSVQLFQLPAHGRTSISPTTGRIVYRPQAGFAGTDTFTYRVKDRLGHWSKLGHVTVIVHRPTANADFADTDGVNPVDIDILENDSDPDGALAPSSVTITQSPAHGQLALNPANGVVTYTPSAGFRGTDNFTYKVRDEHGVFSNPATVTLIVHQPKASDDFATTSVNSPVTIDVAENDKDPDGALVDTTVAIVRNATHGSAQVNPATGEVTYIPNTGFTGTDRFAYRIQDEHGVLANPATVTVVVRGPNQINDKVFDTDGSAQVTIASVDANDHAKGVNPASVAIVTQPKAGMVRLDNATGNMTYQAPAGFDGTVNFAYAVAGADGPITVTVIVNRPTANDDFADTDGVNPVTIDVLENDTDPDGALNAGSVQVVEQPAHGTVSIDHATGEITYTPFFGTRGADSFTYLVFDEHGAASKPARVNLIVHQPVANDDFAQGSGQVLVNVLENDHDPDGALNPASVFVVKGPKHGTLSLDAATGDLTFTPFAGFHGTDSFKYLVFDVHGAASNVATATVIVL